MGNCYSGDTGAELQSTSYRVFPQAPFRYVTGSVPDTGTYIFGCVTYKKNIHRKATGTPNKKIVQAHGLGLSVHKKSETTSHS